MATNDDESSVGVGVEAGLPVVTTDSGVASQLRRLIQEAEFRKAGGLLDSTLFATEPIDANNVDSVAVKEGLTTASDDVQKAVDAQTALFRRFMYVDSLNESVDPDPEPLRRVELPRLVRYADGNDHESDHPVFILDALIFIQGQEVSEYLSGSLTITKNTVDGASMASFRLTNESDRFIWNEDNLRDIYGYSHPRVKKKLQEAQAQGIDAVSPEALEILLGKKRFNANETIKQALFEYKANPTRNPVVFDAANVPHLPRFDLQPNKCCFARMDPVRIFTLYPFRPRGQLNAQERELWMPEFTGYVFNVSVEEDNVTGASYIHIECQDIVQEILGEMRISFDPVTGITNPLNNVGFRPFQLISQAGDGRPNNPNNKQQQLVTAAAEAEARSGHVFDRSTTQFYDDVVGSIYGQPFSSLPMEAAVKELLVFKGENLEAGVGNRGVRNIELGGTFSFNPTIGKEASRKFLQDWHTFCLFGPKRRPWTKEEVYEVGERTTTDGEFAPNAVRLWFLLPDDGTGPKSVADLSTINAHVVHDVNWTNRAEVLRNLVSSLDYRMFVAPTGDLICEFPMIDFRPEDFGEYKDAFRVNKALTNTNFGDEQQRPLAGLILAHGFTPGSAGPNDASGLAQDRFQRQFVFSPFIAARYGITTELVSVPHLTVKDQAIAQQRAVIEFQKRNANCNVLHCTFSYRPFILPNRPVHHLARTRIGNAVSVSTIYDFGSDTRATVDVGMEWIRTWTGYYREEVQQPADPAQQQEIAEAETTMAHIHAPDGGNSTDLIELQVYTNVMGGQNGALTTRFGWGLAEDGQAIVAPAAGVYILNKLTTPKREQSSTETAHEPPASRGAVAPPAGEAEEPAPEEDVEHVFASNPLPTALVEVSPFGPRKDPFGGISSRPHAGADLEASVGTPLLAVDAGVITKHKRNTDAKGRLVPNAAGYQIWLKTDSGYSIAYFHCDDTSAGVEINGKQIAAGTRVKAGDKIGFAGRTGTVTGPHLHIEVKKGNGPQVDPIPYFPGPVRRRKK